MFQLLQLLHPVSLTIGELTSIFFSLLLGLQQLIVRLSRNSLDSIRIIRNLVISLINLLPKLTNLCFVGCFRVLELALQVLEFELILSPELRSLSTLQCLLLGNPILKHLELSQHFLPLLLEIPEKCSLLIG